MDDVGSVAIVGMGLIGGSLARDLAMRGVHVRAWDEDGGVVRDAVRQGIAEPWMEDDPVDVILLAVPVLAAPAMLRRVMRRMDGVRLVTDAGSTKRNVVAAAEALGIGDRFVGSHPLAGDHRSGWDASRAGLFDGARVYLTPTSSSSDDAMAMAHALWARVGGRPEVIDAAAHDRRLAWTSHLPQLVSSALAGALAGAGIPRDDLGPGGRDVTRLAGSSPEMWADVAADNADEIAPALDAIIHHLTALRTRLRGGDHASLRDTLAAARAWHADGGNPAHRR